MIRPELSVVIAATDSAEAVDRAVAALELQSHGRIEIIVADEPGLGVPRLRRIGLEASQARIVAFVEDSCLVQPGWADAWITAFEDPTLIASSGLVEHEDASPLDQAVVFCEYAPFLAPAPTGPPTRLAGNNFAVLRDVALANSTTEVHETALLTSISGRVRTVEAAIVRHVRRFGWREAFADRFRFGLEYGRIRTLGASPLMRWAGLLAGPAIYALQVARLAATLLRNRRQRRRFVATLPITLLLLASWSLGEWLGWSLGPPTFDSGNSRKGGLALPSTQDRQGKPHATKKMAQSVSAGRSQTT